MHLLTEVSNVQNHTPECSAAMLNGLFDLDFCLNEISEGGNLLFDLNVALNWSDSGRTSETCRAHFRL